MHSRYVLCCAFVKKLLLMHILSYTLIYLTTVLLLCKYNMYKKKKVFWRIVTVVGHTFLRFTMSHKNWRHSTSQRIESELS